MMKIFPCKINVSLQRAFFMKIKVLIDTWQIFPCLARCHHPFLGTCSRLGRLHLTWNKINDFLILMLFPVTEMFLEVSFYSYTVVLYRESPTFNNTIKDNGTITGYQPTINHRANCYKMLRNTYTSWSNNWMRIRILDRIMHLF